MKTAILVNGIYRPEDWSVESLLKNIEVVFPDTDVFFHTWDECLSDVPEGIKVESCPEPMLDYNPMQDPEPSKSPHYIGRRETRKDEDIAIRGTKQLVGYADLYEKVNEGYDRFIRLRWDSVIDPKVDFSKLLDESCERPIGFMSRLHHRWSYDKSYGEIHESHGKERDCYLPDMMIFHHRDHFDPSLVYELHEDEKLWPSEWGWYQILCEPHGNNIHKTYHYGAKVARHCLM